MSSTRNPGRVAGLWYLLLVFFGPLRLIYIPSKLFVPGNASATADNLASHIWLFRAAIAADLAGAIVIVFMTLAFYRLFKDVDQQLAASVVIFGGIMPALLYLVNVANDLNTAGIISGAGFLSVFDKAQRDALAMLSLRWHDNLNTAAEILWGVWLFPLGSLVYKSRFLPRFIGVWLWLNGSAYILMSFSGVLAPHYQGKLFAYAQPALFAEIALMLWLVIRGARPPVRTSLASGVGSVR